MQPGRGREWETECPRVLSVAQISSQRVSRSLTNLPPDDERLGQSISLTSVRLTRASLQRIGFSGTRTKSCPVVKGSDFCHRRFVQTTFPRRVIVAFYLFDGLYGSNAEDPWNATPSLCQRGKQAQTTSCLRHRARTGRRGHKQWRRLRAAGGRRPPRDGQRNSNYLTLRTLEPSRRVASYRGKGCRLPWAGLKLYRCPGIVACSP